MRFPVRDPQEYGYDQCRKQLQQIGIQSQPQDHLSPARLGWINLLCATLLMYALGRIHGKKEALEKERALHE